MIVRVIETQPWRLYRAAELLVLFHVVEELPQERP